MNARRVAKGVVGGALGLYALACLAGHFGYRALLYPAPPAGDLPIPGGARLVTLEAEDGVAVHALDFPNPAAARTVVYFHGNGEVVEQDAWMAERIVAQGYAVRLAEYRGYGRSRGADPTEAGLYADASAVLDDLDRKSPRLNSSHI